MTKKQRKKHGVLLIERLPEPKFGVVGTTTTEVDGKLVFGFKTDQKLADSDRKKRDAHAAHKARLESGFQFQGVSYPCTSKDRIGLNIMIAAFDRAASLWDEFAVKNPNPSEAELIEAVNSGAVPPTHRETKFYRSDGTFTTLTPELAKKLAGAMDVYANRSFDQLYSDLNE